MLSLDEVMKAVQAEMNYQDAKWGEDKEQSLPGYLLIMRGLVDQASEAWVKNSHDPRSTPLEQVLKSVAVGLRCLETYGVTGSAVATNDRQSKAEETSPKKSNGEATVIVTLLSGAEFVVAKSRYLNCYHDPFNFATMLVLSSGSYQVKETVAQIQAMMQG